MKARLLPAILILTLLFSACGSDSADSPEPAPSSLSTPARLADQPLPSLSPEASQAMASFLNANRALLREGKLYCYDFDGAWSPVLARYTLRAGKLRNYTVLAEDCVPEYLCWNEGYLFYIDRLGGGIERVPEKGGSRELLREGPCDFLSLWEGRLYYCDGEGRFLSMNPDGSDETLLLDGPCAYAYPLGECILYRALNDAGRLHAFWPETGADRSYSHGPAYAPLLWGDRLWYYDGEALQSVDLDGLDRQIYALPAADGVPELLPVGEELLIRGLREENGPAQWEGPHRGPFRQLGRGYRICDWLGGGIRVDTVYEPDGRIRCYLLTAEDGTVLSFLAGRTT